MHCPVRAHDKPNYLARPLTCLHCCRSLHRCAQPATYEHRPNTLPHRLSLLTTLENMMQPQTQAPKHNQSHTHLAAP